MTSSTESTQASRIQPFSLSRRQRRSCSVAPDFAAVEGAASPERASKRRRAARPSAEPEVGEECAGAAPKPLYNPFVDLDLEPSKLSKPSEKEQPQPARGALAEAHLQMECHLAVLVAAAAAVQERVAELGAARAAAERAGECAAAELQALKEGQSNLSRRLFTATATGRTILCDVKASVGEAQTKLRQLVNAAEAENVATAAQIESAEKAVRAAEAIIAAAVNGSAELESPLSGPKSSDVEAVSTDSKPATCGESQQTLAEAAKAAAQSRLTENEAKLAKLQGAHSTVLTNFTAWSGRLGTLARRIVELEGQLDEQRKSASALQACINEQRALDEQLQVKTCSAPVPLRRPPRVFAVSPALSQLAGEYRLLPDDVSDRPAYVQRTSKNEGPAIYLFWSGAEGRPAWAFGQQLPHDAGGDAVSSSQGGLLARSMQAAWTALPDELASSKWHTGSGTVDIRLISGGA